MGSNWPFDFRSGEWPLSGQTCRDLGDQRMRKYKLPVEDQAKFLGGNARRLYKVQAPAKIIRDRVTEIERPDWWPTEEEVRASLRPRAAVSR